MWGAQAKRAVEDLRHDLTQEINNLRSEVQTLKRENQTLADRITAIGNNMEWGFNPRDS